MNELMNNNEITMTSLEVVELINKLRKEEGNEKVKRHADLLDSIKTELEALKSLGLDNERNFSLVEYEDKKGEKRPCYKMNKAGIMQMLNKESPYVRYKTQVYIETLENKLKEQEQQNQQLKLPQTYKEALIALVEEIDAREKAEAERDRLIHQGKLYNTTEIAKELGLKSAKALNKMLEEMKVQYRTNGTWVLYSDYADKGYTSTKQTVLDNGRVIFDRKWTGLGRDFLLGLFNK